MNGISSITWIAVVLLAVGGVNWGLVGLFEFDLVAFLFGEEFGTTNVVTRVVYILVGISALVSLLGLTMTQSKAPAKMHGTKSSPSTN